MKDRDRAVLEFAGRWWRYPGARAQAIRDEFGVSETIYWLWVNRLLGDPAAEAEFPTLVHRLRRVREARPSRAAMVL